ncbi:MAG TPA: shikimate dehydrogenase [Longimicrobium sp.]|nr:shikimate dehydrogenase [Longimicrobium sp.]
MTPSPTSATRLFALLGDPVSHSLSPVFQNAALRTLGLDGVYVALRCASGDVAGLLRGIARAGGGGNVTVPHKEAAAAAVDRLGAAAEATGAVNCFWMRDGEVWGDNTDVDGLRAAIRVLLGRTTAGGSVLVAGAGGAARAAVHVLLHSGAERVVVLNRTAERARDLADRFGAPRRLDIVDSVEALGTESFDLAINATSLGLREGDPLPFPAEAGCRIDAALDMVYSPGGETPWVRAMRHAGIPAADGTEMLLHQGAAAFRRWWDREPPIKVMRAALRANAAGTDDGEMRGDSQAAQRSG